MRTYAFYKQLFFMASLIFISLQAIANQEQQADQSINQLYHRLQTMPTSDMSTRITDISKQLLGKPYLLGALGEGIDGQYDQYPLYRTDAFDCETFVDTVLALALASDKSGFDQCIRQIRYRDGQVTFTNRNHFASLDWNKNNQRQGFVKDITEKFVNEKNQPVAKMATALINKPAWYQHFDENRIRVDGISEAEKIKRLEKLKIGGSKLKSVSSSIPYIPLTALFDKAGKANEYLFKQIPNAAIIEIVRPNWELSKQIGTNLNVSHLGFAIWSNGTLMFREASSTEGQTIDVPLIDYLHNALKSPTIKGINVQIVVPGKPLSSGCKIES